MKKLGLLSLVLILSFTVIACSGETENAEQGQDENSLITIKHELDEVTLSQNPEKIVVFDYGILDALDYIGEDIVALPKQTLPDYLDIYKGDDYLDAGSLKEPNFEKIYELDPDVIFISARQADLYEEFKEIAPTIYLTISYDDYLGSFKHNMEVLGQIFDKEDELNLAMEEVESQINGLNEKARAEDNTALFVMANDGNLSAYGPGSRFGILHKEFGISPVDENIEASTHGQKISFEYIVEKDPDYIYVMDRAAVTGGDISAKQVMENDLIKSTKAYENNNIIYLNSQIWYVSTGGITSTMEMIEEVQSSLE